MSHSRARPLSILLAQTHLLNKWKLLTLWLWNYLSSTSRLHFTQVSGWWHSMCCWVWTTASLIHVERHLYSAPRGAGRRCCPQLRYWFNFMAANQTSVWASASVLWQWPLEEVHILMGCAASPAGSGLCPPNCNHRPVLLCTRSREMGV